MRHFYGEQFLNKPNYNVWPVSPFKSFQGVDLKVINIKKMVVVVYVSFNDYNGHWSYIELFVVEK